jgi:hypothetical protein
MKIHLYLFVFGFLFLSACMPNQTVENTTEQKNQSVASAPAPEEPILPNIPADAARLSSNAYDYNVLVPLFPEILSYTGKQTTGGENYKMGGGMVATATASYSHNDRRFNVTIHDVGNNTALLNDIAKWNSFTANEDNAEGIHKNFEINRNPAFIHFDKASKTGSISMIHNSRFIIDISGRNINPEDLDLALDQLKVERLK